MDLWIICFAVKRELHMRLLRVCMCLFVVAGCRMASVPDDGEKQGISLAAVRYMASVGGVGAETVEVVLQNGSGNGLRVLSQLSKLPVYWIVL